MSREISINGRRVSLTRKEIDLLELLVLNPGKVFTRAFLLKKVWDYSYEGYNRTIDTHINRLRAKVENDPKNPQIILTVWGFGYKASDEHPLQLKSDALVN